MPIIVFINGFLAPKDYVSFNSSGDFKVISVNPSGVSSLHDRVIQIFYQLKGGLIHYGEKHSKFHGHAEIEENTTPALFPEWDDKNPIHIVGHSYGGLTARVLHQYICNGNEFEGYVTNSSWIKSIVTISAPLNGSSLVYSLGANVTIPPIARWGSIGFFIGIVAHIIEFLHVTGLRKIYDFRLDRWRLAYYYPNSIITLFRALFGICIHTTTDIASFDMTIHSQFVWQQYLETRPDTYYLSIVSTNSYSSCTSWSSRFFYWLRHFSIRNIPQIIMRSNYSTLLHNNGFDGMLFSTEQSHPQLHQRLNSVNKSQELLNSFELSHREEIEPHVTVTQSSIADLQGGVWYVMQRDMDHVGVISDPALWELVFKTIKQFDDNPIGPSATTNAKQQHSMRAHNAMSTIVHNCCHDNRPDMQYPLWTGKARSEVHLGWTYFLVMRCLFAVGCYSFAHVIWQVVADKALFIEGIAIVLSIGAVVPLTLCFLFGFRYYKLSSLKRKWQWTTDDVELSMCMFRIVLCFYGMCQLWYSQSYRWQPMILLLALSYYVEIVPIMLSNFVVFDYFVPMSKVFLSVMILFQCFAIFSSETACKADHQLVNHTHSLIRIIAPNLCLNACMLIVQAMWSLLDCKPLRENHQHSKIKRLAPILELNRPAFNRFWIIHWSLFLIAVGFTLSHFWLDILNSNATAVNPTTIQVFVTSVAPIHIVVDESMVQKCVFIVAFWILFQKFRSLSEIFQILYVVRYEPLF